MATDVEILDFCTERLAEMLDIDAAGITPATSFASLGLDSATAVHFVLEVEQWMNIELYPAVTNDYPTVAAFVAYVASLPA